MIHLRTITLAGDGRITPEDHHLIAAMWKTHHADPPPRTILPTLGAIALNPAPIASAFLYLDATGSGLALLSWCVADMTQPAITRGRAIHHLLTFLEAEARRLNYWTLWTTIAHPALIRHLTKRGYIPTETHLTHLFKTLPAIQSPPPTNLLPSAHHGS